MNRIISILICIILVKGAAFPFDAGTIVLKGIGAEKDDIETTITGLRAAGRGCREVILPGELDKNNDFQSRGNKSLRHGRELYNNMEFDRAESEFKRAISDFEGSISFLKDYTDLNTSHFYLAAIYSLTNRERKAKMAFLSILSIDKNFEPDRRIFSPKIIRKFHSVKKTFRDENINAYICSRYTSITLDGEIRLNPPQEIKLTPRLHGIKNEDDSYYSIMDINKESMIFAGRLTETEHLSLASGSGWETAKSLCDACNAETLIYVTKNGGEITMKEYNFKKIDIPSHPAIEDGTNASTDRAGTPFYKKWWFWSGISSIAGTGAGIYLYNNRSEKEKSGSVVIKW